MQRELVDYFNGKAKKSTNGVVEDSSNQSPELRESLKVWGHASLDTSGYCPDMECAWSKVKNRLSVKREVIPLRFLYWAAASITLLLGGYLVFQSGGISQLLSPSIVVKANGATKEITLPDGSQVWLNGNSEISYHEGEPRDLLLKGEGYFKVIHDSEHPFVVKSKGMTVRVLGTEFDLKSLPGGARLVVVDGVVEFAALDKVVTVQKNQQVDVSVKNNVIKRSEISDTNFLSWKTGVISFSHAPLNTIVKQLQDHYHASISLSNDALKDCEVSVTLKNLTLQESLNVVATLLNGSVSAKNSEFLITANPCQK